MRSLIILLAFISTPSFAASNASQIKARMYQIATSDPDAFDLQNLNDQGLVHYLCAPENGEYSSELTNLCIELNRGVETAKGK